MTPNTPRNVTVFPKSGIPAGTRICTNCKSKKSYTNPFRTCGEILPQTSSGDCENCNKNPEACEKRWCKCHNFGIDKTPLPSPSSESWVDKKFDETFNGYSPIKLLAFEKTVIKAFIKNTITAEVERGRNEVVKKVAEIIKAINKEGTYLIRDGAKETILQALTH
jgi:hypothetical protein